MSEPPLHPPADRNVFAPVAVLAAATLVAYHNSFAVPFLFDDQGSILDNPTIRSLWPPETMLSPPFEDGQTVGGRPLLNVTLALNYALGGTRVAGYHAVNLLLHLAAGLTLFGLVRRTLVSARSPPEKGLSRRSPVQADGAPRRGVSARRSHTLAAFTIALLWLLHPLQTESVTYIIQRAESLVSLCLLLTLYAFVRAADCHVLRDIAPTPPLSTPAPKCHVIRDKLRWRGAAWLACSIAACVLGMASKEVMATAPLLVLLFDRTFFAGSFGAALRARPLYYVALAATWLLLGALVLGHAGRGGTAGFGADDVTPWRYALTQAEAIVRYLALAMWPHPLVFDYGRGVVAGVSAVAPQLLAIAALVGAVAFACARWPRIGFLGVALFALLAPSSSFVPVVSQTAAEHRMYLSLAAVLALAIGVLHRLAGRRAWPALLVAAIAFLALTIARNHAYRTPASLWRDTVAKRSDNPRAHNNLAVALVGAGDFSGALAPALRATQLDPKFAAAHNNLATALAALGRRTEAIVRLETALRLKPAYPEARNNLGKELMSDPARLPAAIAEFEHALRLRPDFADAHINLGLALTNAGRPRDGLPHAEAGVRLAPASYQAHNNLGIALAGAGRAADALAAFARAAELHAAHPSIHENWAKALQLLGRQREADEHFARAAQLRRPR